MTRRNSIAIIGIAFATAALAAPRFAQAQTQLDVYPSAVHLRGARDFQSLVMRTVAPDGLTADVTSRVELSFDPEGIANWDGAALHPVANGTTTLTIKLDDATAQVAIDVADCESRRSPSFALDVLPVLTRAGCNTGACHGSARGQDGFRLSLFGYDPAGDYERVVYELPARRVNRAQPDQSLILQKATGSVTHTGGKLINADSPNYAAIREWIAASTPADPADIPTVASLALYPPEVVLQGPEATQRIVAIAHYTDGSDRDVTHLAALMTSNDQAAQITGDGVVHARAGGEAQILARFGPRTVGTQVIVLPADAPATIDMPPPNNYIDELVQRKLQQLRIAPADTCSDDVFLRRAYLDIVGLLPTVEEHDRFMADERPDKRAALVDELLTRKEFVELWVMQWAERLQIRSTQEVSYKATLLYYQWVQQRIASGVPLREIFRELLTASGGTFTNPAANFYQVERDTRKLAENVAQSCLGIRMQCAQCHNHPFDRWTMDDYYGFAAFFTQIGRKTGEDPRETIIFNQGAGEIQHPVGGRNVVPRFLAGAVPDLQGRDRREVLADWLTSKHNRLFARNVANYVWAHFFATGIVDPVDDVRVSNPPSNEALLDALANRLIETDFDLQALVRDICTSHTYQRATRPGSAGARHFACAQLRRIRAEVLLDVISEVTGAPNKFQGLPLGARAVQIADGNTGNYFLTTFGRATRESVCTCEVKREPNLSQALHLMNGPTVHAKIQQGGRIRQMLEAGQSPTEIIRGLYVACLSRPPTDEEQSRITGFLVDGVDAAPVLEDAFWALLNSKEFLFNH